VAQGELALGELLVERGAEDAGLNPSGKGDRVDLEHPVEGAEVECHRGGVALAQPRLDAADDARPAAEGDRRGIRVRTPIEDRDDLLLRTRSGDQVRDVLVLAPESADDVAVGLAERMGEAVMLVVAGDLLERRRRP